MIEYALLVALLCVALTGAVSQMAESVDDSFDEVGAALAGKDQPDTPPPPG